MSDNNEISPRMISTQEWLHSLDQEHLEHLLHQNIFELENQHGIIADKVFEHIFKNLGGRCFQMLLQTTSDVGYIATPETTAKKQKIRSENVCQILMLFPNSELRHWVSAQDDELIIRIMDCILMSDFAPYAVKHMSDSMGESWCAAILMKNNVNNETGSIIAKTAQSRPTLMLELLSNFGSSNLTAILTNKTEMGNNTMYFIMRSSAATQIVKSVINRTGMDGCLEIMLAKNRFGAPGLLLASNQNPKTVIDFLKLFSKNELNTILKSTNKEGNNILYFFIMSAAAPECLTIVRDRIGSARCLEFMFHRNLHGSSAISLAAQHRRSGILEILEIFDNKEIEMIASHCTGRDSNMLLFIMMSESYKVTLQFIQKAIGDQLFHIMMQKTKNSTPSIVTVAQHHSANIIEILKILPKQRWKAFLTATNRRGLNMLYFIARAEGGTRIMSSLYEIEGGKFCIEVLQHVNCFGWSTISCLAERNVLALYKLLRIFSSREVIQLLSIGDTFAHVVGSGQYGPILNDLIDGVKEDGYCLLALLRQLENASSRGEKIRPRKTWAKLCIQACNKLVNLCKVDDQLRQTFLSQHREQPLFGHNTTAELRSRLQWALNQIKHKCYIICQQPSILLIANSKDRPQAIEEADSLVTAFRRLGLFVNYRTNLKTSQIFNNVERLQSSEESYEGQIVIMMSHGEAGFIFDNEGVSIPLEKLEKKMSPQSHLHCPKVLILQCCQNNGDVAYAKNMVDSGSARHEYSMLDATDAGAKSQARKTLLRYAPTTRHFSVIMSCVSGEVSHRNEFIPKLAAEIEKLERHHDLHSAFLSAHRALSKVQTPIHLNTMSYQFCLKNIYQVAPTSIAQSTEEIDDLDTDI